MKHQIKFILEDIKTGMDSWELHFWIENEDDQIANKLKQDFVFRLKNDWQVSANSTFWGKYYWFIRGSLEKIEGNKKYYNTQTDTCYHKEKFNLELLEQYPEIKHKEYIGEFDDEKKMMIML